MERELLLRFSLPCKHHLLHDKDNKPKWVKPKEPHGKASARAFIGAEAADEAKKSTKVASKQPRTALRTVTLRAVIARLWCMQRPPRPAAEAQLFGKTPPGTGGRGGGKGR